MSREELTESLSGWEKVKLKAQCYSLPAHRSCTSRFQGAASWPTLTL